MSEIHQREDGDYELTLPSGRVAVSAHRESLERLGAEYDQAVDANIAFLEAWKAGVKLAGPSWFEVHSASVGEALDKNELRPNWDLIEAESGPLSHGERVFLYALCAFFNGEWGRELFARFNETGHPQELAQILDGPRIEIIAALMTHYRGW